MCVHVSPCELKLKFTDVFIYGEGCAQVILYIYVCVYESVRVHVCSSL